MYNIFFFVLQVINRPVSKVEWGTFLFVRKGVLTLLAKFVFNVVLKRKKRKYGATFMVAMATSKQCIVVPWEISMQQSNCKSCPIY
jgi:hypothetical protein